jgi:hypothetical protein
MRRDGRPTTAYPWHVAAGCVLVVVDLDREGWRSVTNDATGFVADLAELRPDLLARVPLSAYQDSIGQWDALSVVLHEHLQRAHVRTTPAPTAREDCGDRAAHRRRGSRLWPPSLDQVGQGTSAERHGIGKAHAQAVAHQSVEACLQDRQPRHLGRPAHHREQAPGATARPHTAASPENP